MYKNGKKSSRLEDEVHARAQLDRCSSCGFKLPDIVASRGVQRVGPLRIVIGGDVDRARMHKQIEAHLKVEPDSAVANATKANLLAAEAREFKEKACSCKECATIMRELFSRAIDIDERLGGRNPANTEPQERAVRLRIERDGWEPAFRSLARRAESPARTTADLDNYMWAICGMPAGVDHAATAAPENAAFRGMLTLAKDTNERLLATDVAPDTRAQLLQLSTEVLTRLGAPREEIARAHRSRTGIEGIGPARRAEAFATLGMFLANEVKGFSKYKDPQESIAVAEEARAAFTSALGLIDEGVRVSITMVGGKPGQMILDCDSLSAMSESLGETIGSLWLTNAQALAAVRACDTAIGKHPGDAAAFKERCALGFDMCERLCAASLRAGWPAGGPGGERDEFMRINSALARDAAFVSRGDLQKDIASTALSCNIEMALLAHDYPAGLSYAEEMLALRPDDLFLACGHFCAALCCDALKEPRARDEHIFRLRAVDPQREYAPLAAEDPVIGAHSAAVNRLREMHGKRLD